MSGDLPKYNANTTRIPFGKHRGTLVANLPTSYLAWLLENASGGYSSDWIQHVVPKEIERRRKLMNQAKRTARKLTFFEQKKGNDYHKVDDEESQQERQDFDSAMESIGPEICPF